MPNDRSDAALRERLELAEKATKGPWIKRFRDFQGEDGFGWESKPTVEAEDKMICLFYDRDVDADDVDNDEDDAAHIAANSPDVVRADIEEIIRLRAENNELRIENEALRNKSYLSDLEADWLVMMLSHYTEDCPFRFSQVYEHQYISLDVRGCEKRSCCYDCIAHTPRDCWREVSRNAAMEMVDVCND